MSLQKNTGAVRRFARLLKFGSWLQGISNKVTPPPFRLMQIGSAFWQSRCLFVAVHLDIASFLGDEIFSAEEIAVHVSSHPDATYRLLRMLTSMGVFEETEPRFFRNNKLSSHLRTDHPQNVRAMILMHNSEAMCRPWYEQLEEGIRKGSAPFELIHGEGLFEYLNNHSEFDALFTQAMDTVEALVGDTFATDMDWSQFDRLIDVGGSRGSKSVTILKQHSKLKALVMDRAQTIVGAQDYWMKRVDPQVLERLRFEAGDVLEAVPTATSEKDVYFLSAVLHGFDDESSVKILHNLSHAIGDTGASVVLLELVLPEQGIDLASASSDMQMFMGTHGRERTRTEWQWLLEQADLSLDETVDLRSIGKILVARRPASTRTNQ
ncbi:MAG: methyltransferase [Pseudomonadales bacterium]|nr:methyltransferase [Pseudomonadales bacterium]